MEVTPGYKRTELGVIPEEWGVRFLGDLATVVASGRSSARRTGNYPVYGSTGIIGLSPSPEYQGDAILVARVGANAGRLNFVSGKYGVTDNTIILRLSDDYCLPFFWRQLETKRLNSLVFGSGQPLITGTQLKALPLAIPPLPEQRAIAEALTDVDGLLGALDRLIAKKRDLKQAAMQQLLTGQTRLPDFHGNWETKRISEFTDCAAGGTPSTLVASYWGGSIRWMSSGELNLKRVEDVEGRITEAGLRNSSTKIIPKKCVLVGLAGQGKTRGTVAMNFVELCTNQSIAAIFPSPAFVPEYLYFKPRTTSSAPIFTLTSSRKR
jgi:type I restriction enzyme, S subunit